LWRREQNPFQRINIQFQYELTQKITLTWDAVLFKKTLYIDVPNELHPDASKEAFVTLLEYAEEELNCEQAIVRFFKDRGDSGSLIRTFKFLGFYLLPAGNGLEVPSDKDTVNMVYQIN